MPGLVLSLQLKTLYYAEPAIAIPDYEFRKGKDWGGGVTYSDSSVGKRWHLSDSSNSGRGYGHTGGRAWQPESAGNVHFVFKRSEWLCHVSQTLEPGSPQMANLWWASSTGRLTAMDHRGTPLMAAIEADQTEPEVNFCKEAFFVVAVVRHRFWPPPLTVQWIAAGKCSGHWPGLTLHHNYLISSDKRVTKSLGRSGDNWRKTRSNFIHLLLLIIFTILSLFLQLTVAHFDL